MKNAIREIGMRRIVGVNKCNIKLLFDLKGVSKMDNKELVDKVKNIMCDLFYLSTICEQGSITENLIGVSYDSLEVLIAILDKTINEQLM